MIQSESCPHPSPLPEYQARGQEQTACRDVAITGIGIIFPNAIGNDAFARLFSQPVNLENLHSANIPESEYLHLLSARRIRRMSDYVKLSLAAANVACRDAGVADNAEFLRDCSVLLGTTHGSSSFCSQYYRDIVAEGLPGANPTLFAEGVPNAAAAHLSLMLGIQGACQTVIGTRTAGLDALNLAALRIANGQWDRALVGAAEEHSSIVDDAYRHCHLYAGEKRAGPFAEETGFVAAAAAICFLLERADHATQSHRRIHGFIRRGGAAYRSPPHTASAIGSILDEIGPPIPLLASANATWIDRAEQSAISRRWPGSPITSIYGHIAESFSAGPLASIAAVLLGGLQLPQPKFAALCTDYSGCVSAAVIERPAN